MGSATRPSLFKEVHVDHDLEAKIGYIARVAHLVNRALCRANGDDSQPLWEDAPDWQRKAAVEGVRHRLENPDITPQQTHEEWLRNKKEYGWRYGMVKDPELKTHPCCVPFKELPLEQKAKDFLFQAVVDALR
jgi:hypothetical protein